MSIGWIIFYIFLFAVAAAAIYTWGLIKAQRQNADLMQLLYVKGEKAVVKAIAKNGSQTRQQLEERLKGLRASQFYSKNRVVIQDAKSFADTLLARMVEQNILLVKFEEGRRVYRLTEDAMVKLKIRKK
ncbi:hypothetical protein [Zongyangia hominis]|uniref:Uncharacterized protein n=1 Tax=Zongyangia hominis TaxID=2763677 RepID=A0A926EET6_9FIRM|nr:hypothetical protein [Zongyangia hominis]MBC8571144.1 hypothetical protein [Zongyangia hominis]